MLIVGESCFYIGWAESYSFSTSKLSLDHGIGRQGRAFVNLWSDNVCVLYGGQATCTYLTICTRCLSPV